MGKKNKYPSTLLNVDFIGTDLNKMMDDILLGIDPAQWVNKKNSIINKSLRKAAVDMLPKVKARMRRKTGISALNTKIFKLRSGRGYRIGTPPRKVLADQYYNAKQAKGYYPAAQEYGFTHFSGQHVSGHKAMTDTMEEDRGKAKATIEANVRKALESAVKKNTRVQNKAVRSRRKYNTMMGIKNKRSGL